MEYRRKHYLFSSLSKFSLTVDLRQRLFGRSGNDAKKFPFLLSLDFLAELVVWNSIYLQNVHIFKLDIVFPPPQDI